MKNTFFAACMLACVTAHAQDERAAQVMRALSTPSELRLTSELPLKKPTVEDASTPDVLARLSATANKTLNSFRQSGLASWYGKALHGKKTASGERFDMHALTAAHPSLPLGSHALITNPNNGKSVVVRINDRGPFHGKRVLDLSYAAAKAVGIAERGVGKVVIERITSPAMY